MTGILRKILRCLHPLNKVNISFEFYDATDRGDGRGMKARRPEIVPSPWTFDDLDEEMKELIAKGKQSESAQLRVIKLEKLEEFYGSKWEKIVSRVHAGIRMILIKGLSSEDTFAQVKDDAYVIMFGNKDPHNANNKIRELTEEIHDTFINTDTIAGSMEAEVSGRKGENGNLDLSATSAPDRAPSTLHLEDNQNAGMAAPEKHTALTEGTLAQQQRQSTVQNVYDLSGAASLPDGIEVQFRPLYDVQARSVTGYICTPVYGDREGYDILAGVKNKKLFSDLDQMTLQAARKQAGIALSSRQKNFFIAPVHHNTMADTTNNTFVIQNCAKMTPEEKQIIFFELSETPKTMGELALKGLIDKLKPYTKHIILETDIYGSSRKNLSGLGISLLSVDIRSTNLPEHALIPPMEKFVSEVKKSSLGAILYGINSPALAKSAKDVGFMALGGDALHPLVKETDKPIKIKASL